MRSKSTALTAESCGIFNDRQGHHLCPAAISKIGIWKRSIHISQKQNGNEEVVGSNPEGGRVLK
jgi:hypothetical protein